jgi:hypothetical protein
LGLAVCHGRTGRAEEAEALYRRLRSADPSDLNVLWNLAVLYHRRLIRIVAALAELRQIKAAQAPAPDAPASSPDPGETASH